MSMVVLLMAATAWGRPPAAPTVFEWQGPGASQPIDVTVQCGDTEVARSTGTGEVTLQGVPGRGGGRCSAHFTGPIDAWFAPVLGGTSYQCRLLDGAVFCNGWQAPPTAPAPPAAAPKLVATVQPVATGASGPVSVSFSTPDLAQWGLLVCPGGARLKADFEQGKAVFAEVPDEDCVLSLKGGRPGRFAGVRPGDRLECAATGEVSRCHRPDAVPRTEAAVPRARTGKSYAPQGPKEEAAAGQLIIRLTDPSLSSAVEVNCPGGHRARKAFSGGKAVLEGIPAERCVASFKGGTPARFDGVSGGQSFVCTLTGVMADCSE